MNAAAIVPAVGTVWNARKVSIVFLKA